MLTGLIENGNPCKELNPPAILGQQPAHVLSKHSTDQDVRIQHEDVRLFSYGALEGVS